MNNHNTNSTDDSRFQIHWAKDAFAFNAPISWLVENLIPQGSLNIFVGEPGSKKTLIALDLAACIALGKNWLDRETTQETVLLIDEENGPRRLARRLVNTVRGHYGEEDIPIAFTSLANFNLRTSIHVDILRGLIDETKAKLVIIDALADIMPGADENSVKDVMPVFINLRSLAEKYQTAFILIHHTNKSGGYRGSSSLKGAVDMLLKIESEPDSVFIHYKTEKVRDIEPHSFSAKAHFLSDQFWLSPSEMINHPNIGNAKIHVLKYLKSNGPSQIPDIIENPEITSSKSARNAIYELAKEDCVMRVDDGGTGQTATYDLKQKGHEIIKSLGLQ